MSIVTEVICI